MFVIQKLPPESERLAVRGLGLGIVAEMPKRPPDLVERHGDIQVFLTPARSGQPQTLFSHFFRLFVQTQVPVGFRQSGAQFYLDLRLISEFLTDSGRSLVQDLT